MAYQAFQFKDRRADALGNLRVLPDEIVCSILEYLCPRDVARLSCVSRSVNVSIEIIINFYVVIVFVIRKSAIDR